MKLGGPLRAIRKSLLAGLLFLYVAGPRVSTAQISDTQVPDASVQGTQRQRNTEDPFVLQQKRDMAKKRNEARQQDIKKDTDKLLELATELKQYVDKTNENILSVDVIKKAEEIEKLAHTVKDKMKSE